MRTHCPADTVTASTRPGPTRARDISVSNVSTWSGIRSTSLLFFRNFDSRVELFDPKFLPAFGGEAAASLDCDQLPVSFANILLAVTNGLPRFALAIGIEHRGENTDADE